MTDPKIVLSSADLTQWENSAVRRVVVPSKPDLQQWWSGDVLLFGWNGYGNFYTQGIPWDWRRHGDGHGRVDEPIR